MFLVIVSVFQYSIHVSLELKNTFGGMLTGLLADNGRLNNGVSYNVSVNLHMIVRHGSLMLKQTYRTRPCKNHLPMKKQNKTKNISSMSSLTD